MSYTVVMVQFRDSGAVEWKKLFGTSPTVADAMAKGRHEISISALQNAPIGFQVKDAQGQPVHTWQLGDDQ